MCYLNAYLKTRQGQRKTHTDTQAAEFAMFIFSQQRYTKTINSTLVLIVKQALD